MTKYPTRPSMRIDQYPMLRRFFQTEYGGGRLAELYEFRAASEEITNTVMALRKQGRAREAAEYERENIGAIRNAARRKGMDKVILNLRRQERHIFFSNQMDNDEKEIALKRIEEVRQKVLSDLAETRRRSDLRTDLPFPLSALNT